MWVTRCKYLYRNFRIPRADNSDLSSKCIATAHHRSRETPLGSILCPTPPRRVLTVHCGGAGSLQDVRPLYHLTDTQGSRELYRPGTPLSRPQILYTTAVPILSLVSNCSLSNRSISLCRTSEHHDSPWASTSEVSSLPSRSGHMLPSSCSLNGSVDENLIGEWDGEPSVA